jgi:hypothetical protein
MIAFRDLSAALIGGYSGDWLVSLSISYARSGRSVSKLNSLISFYQAGG